MPETLTHEELRALHRELAEVVWGDAEDAYSFGRAVAVKRAELERKAYRLLLTALALHEREEVGKMRRSDASRLVSGFEEACRALHACAAVPTPEALRHIDAYQEARRQLVDALAGPVKPIHNPQE